MAQPIGDDLRDFSESPEMAARQMAEDMGHTLNEFLKYGDPALNADNAPNSPNLESPKKVEDHLLNFDGGELQSSPLKKRVDSRNKDHDDLPDVQQQLQNQFTDIPQQQNLFDDIPSVPSPDSFDDYVPQNVSDFAEVAEKMMFQDEPPHEPEHTQQQQFHDQFNDPPSPNMDFEHDHPSPVSQFEESAPPVVAPPEPTFDRRSPSPSPSPPQQMAPHTPPPTPRKTPNSSEVDLENETSNKDEQKSSTANLKTESGMSGRAKDCLLDLIYWRDPKKSGVVFGTTLLLLLCMATYSVISVAAYLG
jgi:hypothetical protein